MHKPYIKQNKKNFKKPRDFLQLFFIKCILWYIVRFSFLIEVIILSQCAYVNTTHIYHFNVKYKYYIGHKHIISGSTEVNCMWFGSSVVHLETYCVHTSINRHFIYIDNGKLSSARSKYPVNCILWNKSIRFLKVNIVCTLYIPIFLNDVTFRSDIWIYYESFTFAFERLGNVEYSCYNIIYTYHYYILTYNVQLFSFKVEIIKILYPNVTKCLQIF